MGDEQGNYTIEANENLEEVIAKAQAVVAAASASQVFIDSMNTELERALETYQQAIVVVIASDSQEPDAEVQYRLTSGLYYIRLTDTDLYLTSPDSINNAGARVYCNVTPLSTTSRDLQTGQVWNVQYNAMYTGPDRYTIVSELNTCRSEESRVGIERVLTCRELLSTVHMCIEAHTV